MAEHATLMVADTANLRVVRGLQRWIAEDGLADGQSLPSERMLAERFNVARGTVRVALDQLERDGVIAGREARRRRVVNKVAHRPDSVMADTIAMVTTIPVQPVDAGVPTGWERYIDLGALDTIRDEGMHALTLLPGRLDDEKRLRRLLNDPPKGVLFTRRALEDKAGRSLLGALQHMGVRIVVYGDSKELAGFDRVASDHAAGAYQLTQWLLAQGRRRILRLWPFPSQRFGWLDDRDQGYERAMREAGLEPLPALCVGEMLVADGTNLEINRRMLADETNFEINRRMLAGFLLDQFKGEAGADALMVVSDAMVYAVGGACRLLGKEPGRDVLIAGYDNYYAGASDSLWEKTPPAATIDKRNWDMGREMVKLLMERLAGKLSSEPERRLVEPKLVVVQHD